MTASFELEGQQFTALNGGPRFAHRGRLIRRELRDARRGGRVVGKAFRRRPDAAMRLAEGQVRPLSRSFPSP